MGNSLWNHSGATIKDIAREAGVSKATVSLVINGSPKISSRTHEKVKAIIQNLCYQPSEEARKLAKRRWTGSLRADFEVVPADEVFPPGRRVGETGEQEFTTNPE